MVEDSPRRIRMIYPRPIIFQLLTCYGSLKKKKFAISLTTTSYISKRCYRESSTNLKITLNLFKDNQMMTNPGKFKFMVLSKNTINQSIIISNKTIESSNQRNYLG